MVNPYIWNSGSRLNILYLVNNNKVGEVANILQLVETKIYISNYRSWGPAGIPFNNCIKGPINRTIGRKPFPVSKDLYDLTLLFSLVFS